MFLISRVLPLDKIEDGVECLSAGAKDSVRTEMKLLTYESISKVAVHQSAHLYFHAFSFPVASPHKRSY